MLAYTIPLPTAVLSNLSAQLWDPAETLKRNLWDNFIGGFQKTPHAQKLLYGVLYFSIHNRECSVLERKKIKNKILVFLLHLYLSPCFVPKYPTKVDVPSNLRRGRLCLILGGHAWHARIPKDQLPWAQTKSSITRVSIVKKRNGSHTLLCSSLLHVWSWV